MKRKLKHFYKMRPLPGLLLALPALMMIGGLSWESFATQQAYRSTLKETPGWSLALMQLSLHDTLFQNKRRLQAKLHASTETQSLRLLNFTLTQKNLERLLNAHNKKDYAKALLTSDGQNLKVKLRQRGGKHWHHISPKKSLKVQLKSGDFLAQNRNFNLSNPHQPFLIADQIIMSVAQEIGILTTDTDFVRVHLNGLNLGVFHYQTRPEELTLRKQKRFPAAIYTLDHLSGRQQFEAWNSASQWEQLSGAEIQPMRLDLRHLLAQVAKHQTSDQNSFRDFALTEIDLEAFARLEALNILFGEEQVQNFALYFDIYKGHWEPILYETDAFHHQEQISLTQNPLFQALNSLPEYQWLKQNKLEYLMSHQATPTQIKARSERLIQRILPALSHDPYWQAIKQLPDINAYYRQMLRPMNTDLLLAEVSREMQTYQQRFDWLQTQRSQNTSSAPARPQSEDIYLGPGTLSVTSTQVYQPHQRVWVKAGTVINMSSGTSLIFRGPVYFQGRAEAPIVIQANPQNNPSYASATWGGIALQGQSTSGSRLEYVTISGGSSPVWQQNSYPGMINIHNSHSITLNNNLFHHNRDSDDLLHVVYVDDFQAQNNRVLGAFSDAWDLEFTRGNIQNLQVLTAGDDGLDLMGSDIKLKNSRFIQCQGNGLSAGEESHVQVQNVLFAHSGTGILSKHASSVQVLNSLSYGNQQGLEVYQPSPNYPGASRLTGKAFYLLNNQIQQKKDPESLAHLNLLASPINISSPAELSTQPPLAELQHSLNLHSWSELELWLTQQRSIQP